jgi:hypothetical protein
MGKLCDKGDCIKSGKCVIVWLHKKW